MKRIRIVWYWLLSLPLLLGVGVLGNLSDGSTKTSGINSVSNPDINQGINPGIHPGINPGVHPGTTTGYVPGISSATLGNSSSIERRWKCHRLGKLSTSAAPNPRCWFYCFDESLYRIYRLPEANGTPCWVDRNYPKGTCRYSRCRQPNMKKRWWFGKLFRRRPKDSKE
uniref:Basic tail secreted protein n=1 Tax=Rhipicephalus zambeziensis TaxID=60191 RepID=A0A224Y1T7_9ACAR